MPVELPPPSKQAPLELELKVLRLLAEESKELLPDEERRVLLLKVLKRMGYDRTTPEPWLPPLK